MDIITILIAAVAVFHAVVALHERQRLQREITELERVLGDAIRVSMRRLP